MLSWGFREAEKMRGEARENISSGLWDKPEWVQFSGIQCNDRGEERVKKGAGKMQKGR